MTFFPVITRELREESRRSGQYWLRIIGAAAAVFFVFLWTQGRPDPQDGLGLFLWLHCVLLVLIWLFVPAMTADCIARERREGTLGLLFLTPLTARGIVIGKSFVQMLKALALFLAIIPVLTVPLLMGGLSWIDAGSAFAIQFCSILLAMTAGLLASARARVWVRALLLAMILAAVHAVVLGLLLMAASVAVTVLGHEGRSWPNVWDWLFVPPGMGTGGPEGWTELFSQPAWFFWVPSLEAWLIALPVSCALVLVWFLASLLLTARWMQGARSELPPGPRQLWLLNTFCTPRLWRALFRRKMSRALDRNPVGWLQQYSWSARLSKWGWCFFIIAAETLLLMGSWTLYVAQDAQLWLALIVVAGLAFSASGSFRRERESGAIELLLVTPLRVSQIVFGRLRGIWGQFLPVMLILLIAWHYLEGLEIYPWGRDLDATGSMLLFAGAAAAVPMIGLYLSLRLRHHIGAWMATLVVSLGVPWLIVRAFGLFFEWGHELYPALPAALLFQLAAGAVAVLLLFRNLRRREFALEGRKPSTTRRACRIGD